MGTAITYKYDASFEKRKRVVLIGLVLILLLGAIYLAMPMVMARDCTDDPSDWSEWHVTYQNYLDGIKDEVGDGMYTSIDALYSDNEYTDGVNAFFSAIRTDTQSGSAFDIFKKIGDALAGIGMFVVVVYSFVHLFKELERGDGSFEMWAKCFVIVTVGLIVVINWAAIIEALESLGNLIKDQTLGAIANANPENGVKQWLEDHVGFGTTDLNELDFSIFDIGGFFGDLFENIWIYIKTSLKYVASTVLLILFEIPLMGGRIVLLTILLELMIRKAFFPLAIADVCGNGARSPGISYMKKFLALYIRIAMCFVIATLGNLLTAAVAGAAVTNDNFITGILRFICIFVVYTTCTKLYSNTSTIANQIVGS